MHVFELNLVSPVSIYIYVCYPSIKLSVVSCWLQPRAGSVPLNPILSEPLFLRYFCQFSFVTGSFAGRLRHSSVTQSCPTLCDAMDLSTPGLPVHHQLLESTQTHVHWVGDAIQWSHPLSSPSVPAFNPFQHQGLFWVSSSHQVAKVLEFQLQHQFFRWTLRTDLL